MNAEGGAGNDFFPESTFGEALKDSYVGGDGNDAFDAENRPEARDLILCREGFDRVIADTKERSRPTARGCSSAWLPQKNPKSPSRKASSKVWHPSPKDSSYSFDT